MAAKGCLNPRGYETIVSRLSLMTLARESRFSIGKGLAGSRLGLPRTIPSCSQTVGIQSADHSRHVGLRNGP